MSTDDPFAVFRDPKARRELAKRERELAKQRRELEERAKAVADVLKSGLTQPNRIVIEGKGADSPSAPNTTAEGRAKNRRVEIFIERSE